MYSVLVVDDFAYDRQNLVNMVASFDDLPLCVVGMCENGYEALEAVHNLQPDVLICDVEMPGMNGIELANALREENNRAHIVFCSLYDKVHYLQAAIQLNCDGYLMKPVSRQELDGCLRQILLRLLDVKVQKETYESLQRAMAENRLSLTRDFFSDVLMSNDFSAEYLQHRREQLGLGPELRFRLALLEVNMTNAVSAEVTQGDASLLCFRTLQSLKRDTGWKMPYYIVRVNERRYAVVFCFTEGEDTARLTEQALNSFVSHMRSAGVSITATFGSQVAQIGELRRQYELCRHRLSHRWQYGGDPVIFSDDDDVQTTDPMTGMAEVNSELRMLLNLESTDIRRAAGEYVSALLDGQPLFQQQMICYYLLGNVRCIFQEDHLAWEQEAGDPASPMQRVMQLENAADCLSFASDLIVRAYGAIHKSEKNAGSDLIGRVKRFILESDLRSVHLRLIADHFSYSPNYLNHVFKSATGETILDYITACRIDRAKDLMQTTNMRLSEIAEEIGYSHATYLSIVFKKQEGVTPKQYMERCRL